MVWGFGYHYTGSSVPRLDFLTRGYANVQAGDLLVGGYWVYNPNTFAGVIHAPSLVINNVGLQNPYGVTDTTHPYFNSPFWLRCAGGETYIDGTHSFSGGGNEWTFYITLWRGSDGEIYNSAGTSHSSNGNTDTTSTDTHTAPALASVPSNAVAISIMGQAQGNSGASPLSWNGPWQKAVSVTGSVSNDSLAIFYNLVETGSVTPPTLTWSDFGAAHAAVSFFLKWDGVTLPPSGGGGSGPAGATGGNGGNLLASI
jgi:hypothetical protein